MNRVSRTIPMILLAAAGAACVPADSYGLSSIDLCVLEWSGDSGCGSTDRFMRDVSEAWNPENLILASLPVMVYGDERAFLCLELAWKSLMISEATTAALKWSTNRQRPDGEPHSRANSSFPSSHASSSFAVAFSISTCYPKWSIPAYGAAALVSYSRVYLNAHHAGDVIVGAGIGVLGGYLANRYLREVHVDRGALVDKLPVRIDVGEGLGSLRVYLSRSI